MSTGSTTGGSMRPAATSRPQNWRPPTTVRTAASPRPPCHNRESPDSPGRFTEPPPDERAWPERPGLLGSAWSMADGMIRFRPATNPVSPALHITPEPETPPEAPENYPADSIAL